MDTKKATSQTSNICELDLNQTTYIPTLTKQLRMFFIKLESNIFYKNILYRQFKELFKNLRPRIK